MNPETKEKWVDALRSGRYKQGVDCLRTHDDRYCCLGVLCDVTGTRWRPHTLHDRYVCEGESLVMPRPLIVKTGLSRRECGDLAHMNDTGSSFSEIAEYIEKYL